jgi:hypothetical protein
VKVLMTAAEAIADPEAWLDLRREYLTASDMAALAGVEGAWTTPTGVYWGKVAGDRKPRGWNGARSPAIPTSGGWRAPTTTSPTTGYPAPQWRVSPGCRWN